MSTYTDASLIYYPSGVKLGKAYSLKPTDGSGDLDFTRASTATRVNEQGLIEGVRTNLILQSNTFDTTWTNTSTTLTSGQSGYDGTNNAWLLTKPATSFARIQQTFSSTSGLKTFSVYLKAGTLSWCRLFAASAPSPNIYVNLSNGSLGSQYDNISATSIDVGAGWYRVSLTFDASISEVRIYPADANDSVSGISGSIYIQDAQLEASVQATEYIPTTTTAVSVGITSNIPRIDYTGGGCGKLLLEPQRTNLLTLSNYIDGWGKTNVSVTSNDITSPDGYQNASKLERNATGGYVSLNTSASGSQAYSVFLKKGNLNFGRILAIGTGNPNVYFDLENGSVGTASNATGSIVDYGNGWYRCTMVYSETITAVRIYPVETDNSTGGALGYVYAYEAQCESGTYATSIIPTLGTAVTRVADSASKSGISSLINSAEGVLYAQVKTASALGTGFGITLTDGTVNNRVYIGKGTANTQVFGAVTVGGSNIVSISGSSYSDDSYIKIAFSYKSGETKLFINGIQIGSTSLLSFTLPTLSKFAFDGGLLAATFYGECQSLMIFPTALTDTELATLTT